MAGGIDTSNRKPRRLRGTPALKYISKLSIITLAVCSGIGYFLYTRPVWGRIEARFYPDEQVEQEQRDKEDYKFMLTNQLVGQKQSSEIRKILRHKKKYETET